MIKTKVEKVKLQNWVSVEQAAAIKDYLDKGKALKADSRGSVEVLPTSKPSVAPAIKDVSGLVDMKEVAHWKEQARLQGIRADDELGLRLAADWEMARMKKEIDQLNQTGGSERQGRYISLLLSKLEAAGVKRSEYDQEAAS